MVFHSITEPSGNFVFISCKSESDEYIVFIDKWCVFPSSHIILNISGVSLSNKQSDIIVPLDFKKNGNDNHYLWATKDQRCVRVQADNFYKAFIQLNSHTDKNAGIRDIVPKSEKPSTSFKIKESDTGQDEFVPVWKSKTVYIKPDEYRTEKDTTYTSDVSDDITDDEPHEKRYVPYHSVRGHTRRLRKGDITSVRAHFRGHKEYGAIHKNYVLAAPRIIRKGKII